MNYLNKRTAAIILIDDVVVLACKHPHNNAKEYTFVSRKAWLPEDLEAGDELIAQSKSLNELAKVHFSQFLDIEDLDLETDYEYKFVLGPIPEEIRSHIEEVETRIRTVLKTIKRQRIDTLREGLK